MVIISCIGCVAGFIIGLVIGFACGLMANQSVTEITTDREWREGHLEP